MDLNLKNKMALITGGSRGIGKAIAMRLAEEGCHVAVFLSSDRASWINGANIPVDGAQGRPAAF